jgi:predicted DNA-binding transcriptional regulator AlpA
MPQQLGSRELADVLRRFFDLLVRDQLVGYQLIRERLAEKAGAETEHDLELRKRHDSLEALAAVAQHLGLSEERAPTVKQFDRVAGELELGWNSARVARLWGRWRFATDAFEGRRVRPTQHSIETQRRLGHRVRTYSDEDCVCAISRWLASEPIRATLTSFERWQALENDRRRAGESYVPGWRTIASALQIGFKEAVQVARGDLSLADAQNVTLERRQRDRLDWSRTEHHFVGLDWLSKRLGVTREQVKNVTRRGDFPQPVVTLERRRGWLQEDIEAYIQGEPSVERTSDALQQDYLTSGQAAAMIGRDRASLILGLTSLPKPAGMVSNRFFFLRSEVEDWMRDNPEKVGPEGRLRARRSDRRGVRTDD